MEGAIVTTKKLLHRKSRKYCFHQANFYIIIIIIIIKNACHSNIIVDRLQGYIIIIKNLLRRCSTGAQQRLTELQHRA